jgi:hypothetical protein
MHGWPMSAVQAFPRRRLSRKNSFLKHKKLPDVTTIVDYLIEKEFHDDPRHAKSPAFAR